jgi:hypothetical protein
MNERLHIDRDDGAATGAVGNAVAPQRRRGRGARPNPSGRFEPLARVAPAVDPITLVATRVTSKVEVEDFQAVMAGGKDARP